MARLRVLVVDDEPMVLSSVRRLLGHQGHEVVTAGDGMGALARLDASEFDVVLLDLMMPSAPDGVAVYESLSAPLRERVVCMSGGSLMARVLGFMKKHPSALFLEKPFDASSLGASLHAVVGARMPADGLMVRDGDGEEEGAERT